jgi:tRNA G18 (ribose-2'-O)-methylase SpoU
MSRQLVIIAHNLRSAHNVGSILRTADGLGVSQVYLTGYTPYPETPRDERLPHIAAKASRQINKTALGAAQSQAWQHCADVLKTIQQMRQKGFTIVALEQDPSATSLLNYTVPEKVAVLVGREVQGLEPAVLKACDQIVEIPMVGQKESFNVAIAAAIAAYHCIYWPGAFTSLK